MRGPLWFWSYLYYLSKYYELFDTVLQLLKGRPPPHFFLHVYHHATVLLMAWFWLQYAQSLQFIGLLFNASVHVVMYYYYFRRVLGWSVWWKRYVTNFQIVQFGTSAVCYVVTLALLASGAECAGTRVLQHGQTDPARSRHCGQSRGPPVRSGPQTREASHCRVAAEAGLRWCSGACSKGVEVPAKGSAYGFYCLPIPLLLGIQVLAFNFFFNMTLLYQFVGVLGGGVKLKGVKQL